MTFYLYLFCQSKLFRVSIHCVIQTEIRTLKKFNPFFGYATLPITSIFSSLYWKTFFGLNFIESILKPLQITLVFLYLPGNFFTNSFHENYSQQKSLLLMLKSRTDISLRKIFLLAMSFLRIQLIWF